MSKGRRSIQDLKKLIEKLQQEKAGLKEDIRKHKASRLKVEEVKDDREVIFECPHCHEPLQWKKNGTFYERQLIRPQMVGGRLELCPKCKHPITEHDRIRGHAENWCSVTYVDR